MRRMATTWSRVMVNVADVIFRSGDPYYRYGNYGYNDRLTVERDRTAGRSTTATVARSGPPYGKAHGYWKKQQRASRLECDRYGRCVTRYYDPRYDRRYYDNRSYSYDRHRYDRYDRDDRYWDGRRWREYDDD